MFEYSLEALVYWSWFYRYIW